MQSNSIQPQIYPPFPPSSMSFRVMGNLLLQNELKNSMLRLKPASISCRMKFSFLPWKFNRFNMIFQVPCQRPLFCKKTWLWRTTLTSSVRCLFDRHFRESRQERLNWKYFMNRFVWGTDQEETNRKWTEKWAWRPIFCAGWKLFRVL